MSDTDFSALIEPIARHFWGEPNKGLSTKVSLRWGNGGSRAIFLDGGGNWKDFESDEGGTVLDLVMRETGADKSGAIEWLEAEGFIPPREGHSGHSRGSGRQEAHSGYHGPPQEEMPLEGGAEAVQKPVKGYRYTDRDGNPLYEVIRYNFQLPDGSWVIDLKTGNPRKTFRQRRPDGRGGYIWNLDGIGHTIYRHPEVEIAIAEGKPVLLVEGERDVETCEALGWTATTNSGGAKHWSETHAALFRGADVIILVDNDDAGREGGEMRAKSLRGIARRIRLLDFADVVAGFPPKADVTDWVEKFGGTRERLESILEGLPDWRPRPPASRFGALGLHELHQPHLKHEFLIDGFLDRRGVAMMPGSSGSGKTFLVLEMGACIALGREFWGMECKPGLVVYQAGEGKEGITKRLDGWMLDRGVDPSPTIPFKVLPRKVNLFVDDKDTDDLIEECKAWSEYFDQPMRMLVVDTFNKAITGANENAGQDMTRVLARLERISETLDCAVVVPMHKGKDGQQRGHTSLTGDVSNVLNVTMLGSKENPLRDSNGRAIRTVALDKNKDGEGGRPIRFVLRQIVLGINEKGNPETTCVVDKPNGDDEQLVSDGRLSARQTIYLQVLKDSIAIDGHEPAKGVLGVPAGKHVVDYAAFLARLRNKWTFTAPEHEIERRNKEFEAAIKQVGEKLLAHGYIDRDNATKAIWWTGKSDRWVVKREAKSIDPPGTGISEEVKREIAETGAPF